MNEQGTLWMDAWGCDDTHSQAPDQAEPVSARRVIASRSGGTEDDVASQHDAILALLESMRENQHRQHVRFMVCNLLLVALAVVYLEALRKDIRRSALHL